MILRFSEFKADRFTAEWNGTKIEVVSQHPGWAIHIDGKKSNAPIRRKAQDAMNLAEWTVQQIVVKASRNFSAGRNQCSIN